MPLNKVKSVRFDLTIPELEKTIHYRAFKHGEQKNILMAFELKDEKAIVNAILDTVAACTFGELDVKKTPMHLIDLVFLKIYIASVGDKSPVLFSCGGTKTVKKDYDGSVEEVPCGLKLNTYIDLNSAALKYPEGYASSSTIQINGDVSLKLRIPDFETFKKFDFSKSFVDIADQFVFAGLEHIIDGDECKVPSVDFTQEELKAWLDDLDASAMEKIAAYFDNIPELVLEHSLTCPNCGRKEVFELHGLDAFFG